MKLEIIDNVQLMSEMANRWNYSPDVALVPTMGFLHEGHLSLVRAAAVKSETVIASIFVNPLQFGPNEDLEKYPRDLQRDAELLGEAGADFIFAPDRNGITPDGMDFSIDPGRIGMILCGKYRPGHFAGVGTIVTKLFNVVRPGCAVFGWKDAQQFLLLKKMVVDFNMPVQIEAMETVREADGLAMSSRNSYLSVVERTAASAIHRGLSGIFSAYRDRDINDINQLLTIFYSTIKVEQCLEVQYAEAVSMDAMVSIDIVQPGNTLIAVAVYAGKTRLIDNLRL